MQVSETNEELFSFVKCWKPTDFNHDEYKEIAILKGWPGPAQVERELLLYDTLYALSAYSPRKLIFKGGTMISRVYLRRSIRFSWDLDFDGRGITSVDDILGLISETNNELRKDGAAVDLGVGNHKIGLGIFELDEEKYVPERLPNLVPIRRVVPALTIGPEIHRYLRKSARNISDRKINSFLKEIRQSLGQIPRMKEVRLDIDLGDNAPIHERKTTVGSILEPEKKPIRLVTDQPVYSIEDVLADKLDDISKKPEPERMMDMAKNIFDVCHLLDLKHDRHIVKIRLESFVEEREELNSVRELYRKVVQNIQETQQETADMFNRSSIFQPARGSLEWQKMCTSTIGKLSDYV